MVEPSKGSISELQFQNIPMLSTFNFWKTNLKTEVCSGSGHPKEATPWIKEDEVSNSVDDFNTSQSVAGQVYPNFETLDASIASALKKLSRTIFQPPHPDTCAPLYEVRVIAVLEEPCFYLNSTS